jgi:tetratricopeptide (TPR) repeat protein
VSLIGQIFECQFLIRSNHPDQAIEKCSNILKDNTDYIPALYTLSLAYLSQKQPPKARNYLKRVSKMEYSSKFATEFENCYILLADLYIQVIYCIYLFNRAGNTISLLNYIKRSSVLTSPVLKHLNI